GPGTAQTFRVSGRVVDLETGRAVERARVQLLGVGDTLLTAATSDSDGGFVLTRISPGSYSAVVLAVGYQARRLTAIAVTGRDLDLGRISLLPQVHRLGALVVTASREPQSILEAPASVFRVTPRELRERPAITVAEHLGGATGVDIVTTGLTQHNIAARGFNNLLSGSLYELIDYRWAAVPSIRSNTYNLIPVADDDIERIEIVLGPGSALYGPNVDRGVMHIVTRSPLESQETSVSLMSGIRGAQRAESRSAADRSFVQASGRHAGMIGERIGFKVSGLYLSGNDWQSVDPAEIRARNAAIGAGADPDTLLIGRRDFETGRYTMDARVDVRVGREGTFTLSGGAAHLESGVELTPVGAAQGLDWTYTYLQARLRKRSLFVQSYVNLSDAGRSFLLRDGQPIVDNSYLLAAQIQHGSNIGSRHRLLYGADLIRTVPRTEGTISGVHENDDELTEVGAYLQSETDLSRMTTLILAGRVDHHNRVGGTVFSPRAALVIRPGDLHSVRFTYNRAFSQPSTQHLFLDISSSPSLGPFTEFGVRAIGVPSTTGLTFRRECNGGLCMYSPFGADPSRPLAVDAAPYWQNAIDGLAAATRQLTGSSLDPAFEAFLRGLDPRGNVAPALRKFDVSALALGDPLDPQSVTDIAPIGPSITNTLEIGFKGFLPPRVFLGLDLYATRVENFVGPLSIETPNVFLDPVTLESFLQPQLEAFGMTPEQATQTINGLAAVPLGTVTPTEVTGPPTDVYVTFRSFGKVELWGADLSATLPLSEALEVAGTYSFASKNYFRNVDGIDDIALNAPRHKGALSARYRNESRRVALEARGRYVGGFEVRSGVYRGTVKRYALIDANISFPLPLVGAGEVTASALNLFDSKHREIIGAPEIGRMLFVRLAHTF
ncbi:MAG: TonB-dependent receptor domain-containing protein, partial [Gemmatimonadales bacterium]